MLAWLRALVVLVALLVAVPAWAGVNVNSANQAELETLPGIGPSKAAAIIQFRGEHGPYKSLADLDAVSGIGPATLATLDGLVEFGDDAAPSTSAPAAPITSSSSAAKPKPTSSGVKVNINTASEAELNNLPGVGPAKAAAIVGERDAHGPFKSCQDLTRVQGIGPATVANLSESCTTE